MNEEAVQPEWECKRPDDVADSLFIRWRRCIPVHSMHMQSRSFRSTDRSMRIMLDRYLSNWYIHYHD
jgi:hypothetical protein